MPNTSVLLYPLPPDTSFTFVTLPFVTVISAVAPTPPPSLFLSGTALYLHHYIQNHQLFHLVRH